MFCNVSERVNSKNEFFERRQNDVLTEPIKDAGRTVESRR